LGPHGLRGEVRVQILTDFPERFGLLKTVYVGEDHSPMVVEDQRVLGGRAVLKLEGIDHLPEAEELRGLLIHIPVGEAMALEEDQYYVHQIVGLEVWTREGEYLGRVAEVLETGSNDVYVVRDGEEILIPALSDVILDVDLEKGRVEVQLMKGLR